MVLLPFLLALSAALAPASKSYISYTLRIDARDVSSFAVTMRVRGAPAQFTVAAAAHPEYDDKYWHYLEDLRVERGSVERIDSVRWRVTAPAGDAVLSYRIRPPMVQGLRSAWRAFLTPSGALVGGPHSFLYVIGLENARADVQLDIPDGWRVATALDPTTDPRKYTARDMLHLVDSPILVGSALSSARFVVNRVPHDIAYLGVPGGTAFDTVAFRAGIEKLARETIRFWGSMPYQRYVFMYEDSAYGGGLEHMNSVTLGAPSSELAKNPNAVIRETAHEFFHTWNLMWIQPAAYHGVDYRVQPPLNELWFSEGLTLFYADLLRRRIGLPVDEPTRQEHVANAIARYISNIGYGRHSAEAISRVAYNAPLGALGEFQGSVHLVGELLGTLLDITVRDATAGARSMDDVMRRLYADSSARHYRTADIERVVAEVCHCNVRPIFDRYVRGGAPIEFDRYLAPLGLRAQVTRTPGNGVDLRMRGVQSAPGEPIRVLLWDPGSSWVRAGLRTNDQLVSINGQKIQSRSELADALRALHVGDTVRFDIVRQGVAQTIQTTASGFEAVSVTLAPLPNATSRQQRLLAAWQSAQ